MSAVRSISYFSTTIGQKQLMGLSGLVWSGFVLGHMLGNLLLFVSPEAYNKYGHAITSNPLIYFIEAFLVGTLLLHIVKGIAVTMKNKSAKPIVAATGLSGAKDSSFAVKTMIYQGVLIAVFVALHIMTFKFGTYYEVNYNGVVIRDLHKLVIEVFQSPVYVFGYVVCLIVLGFHLSHGFYSSLQTLGFNHPKYSPKLQLLGHVYAWVVAIGFISQPLYVYIFAKG